MFGSLDLLITLVLFLFPETSSGVFRQNSDNPVRLNYSKMGLAGAIFSPDKLNLVGYRNEPDIPVWNTRNGVMETTIKTPGLDCHISDLAISADSKRLVGWASKSGIAVWDLRSGLEICTLKHSPMTRFALGSRLAQMAASLQ